MGQLHWQCLQLELVLLQLLQLSPAQLCCDPSPWTLTKPLQSFAANLICKPDGSQTSGMWNIERVNKKLLIIDSI